MLNIFRKCIIINIVPQCLESMNLKMYSLLLYLLSRFLIELKKTVKMFNYHLKLRIIHLLGIIEIFEGSYSRG